MLKSLRSLTEPDIKPQKQFLTPTHRVDSQRKRVFSQNFKKSPFTHNHYSLGHLNEAKTPKKIVVEQEQDKKPFFKLPKIIKEQLKEEELDDVSLKVVKMKKFFYDPYGCSKSSKLQKVRIRKKIMGIGPENKVILEHFALKNRKQFVLKQASEEQEEKYKMKIYGC